MDPICGTGLARIFAQHYLQILRVDCHPAGLGIMGVFGINHVALAAWVSSQVCETWVSLQTGALTPLHFHPIHVTVGKVKFQNESRLQF